MAKGSQDERREGKVGERVSSYVKTVRHCALGNHPLHHTLGSCKHFTCTADVPRVIRLILVSRGASTSTPLACAQRLHKAPGYEIADNMLRLMIRSR